LVEEKEQEMGPLFSDNLIDVIMFLDQHWLADLLLHASYD
jgi:hypothetical protein